MENVEINSWLNTKILLINSPSCDADNPFLNEMLRPQPATWLATMLIILGVVLMVNTERRIKNIGAASLFGGWAIGCVPIMSRIQMMLVDCSQPELMVRLINVMPIANAIAWAVLMASVSCAVFSLWKAWSDRGQIA